jgi:hypothetical protein
MLSRKDIEYLKRVNGVRKRMGLALDPNQVNEHAFLNALYEMKSNNRK